MSTYEKCRAGTCRARPGAQTGADPLQRIHHLSHDEGAGMTGETGKDDQGHGPWAAWKAPVMLGG